MINKIKSEILLNGPEHFEYVPLTQLSKIEFLYNYLLLLTRVDLNLLSIILRGGFTLLQNKLFETIKNIK